MAENSLQAQVQCQRHLRSEFDMTLSYIEHLKQTLSESPPKQKGQRTRQRLRIATAEALERTGYHALRVVDITTAAEVAEGSFYVYFKDKTEATLSVLNEMLEEFLGLSTHTTEERDPFSAIRAANRRWLAVCRANAGLMRCLLQVSDEEPSLTGLAQRANRLWYDVVAQTHVKRRGQPAAKPSVLFATYLLGGMMDELVRKLFIYPDPGLIKLQKKLRADDNALADAASVIWLRVLSPEARPPADLPKAAAALVDWMKLRS
jgi:TetR/AcrR family transcriptional repressor of nem operon